MTSSPTDSLADNATDWTITAFRVFAIAEAISWGALLVAMLFKYALIQNPIGVEIIGPIHGTMFLCYVATTIAVGVRGHWRLGVIVVGMAAAIPPFVTVIFEKWAERTGRLRAPDSAHSN